MLRRSLITLPFLPLASRIAGPALAQGRTQVRITHSTNGFAFLPILVAVSMDFFKEAGVEVEVIRTGSGANALAAAISGDADICLDDPISVLRSRENGTDLVLFGAITNQVNANVVISKAWATRQGVRESSPLEQRFAALRGIKIGVTGVGSGSDHLTRYIAKKGGLDPDRDLMIVGTGSEASVMLAAVDLGRVDAITTSAPTSHLVIMNLGGTMLFNNAAGAIPALNGYFYIGAAANRRWLDANQTKAVAVAKGFQLALSALADPVKSLIVRDSVHARFFSTIDKKTYDFIWSDQTTAAAKSFHLHRDMVKRVVDSSAEFTGKPVDPSVIDASFIPAFGGAAIQP